MPRTLTAALTALPLLAVLALTGCSEDTADDAAPRSEGSTNPTSAPSSAPSSVTSSAPAAPPPLCGTPDLLLTVKAAAGGGTAGATHQEIGFSNEADHACTITGYPGVSYLAGSQQLGAAADQDDSTQPTTVTLQPGDVATAALTISDPGAEPGCRLTNATKLKIYPPDNRRAVVMRIQAAGCADPDVHLLTVGPVA